LVLFCIVSPLIKFDKIFGYLSKRENTEERVIPKN
jgi:hypothetical protein